MEAQLNGITFKVVQGDITTLAVDAIVIPATPDLTLDPSTSLGQSLLLKGGAIIQAECRALGGCEVGQAALTSGGALPAKHIIHAVGPHMGSGNERGKLGSAIWNAMRLVAQQQFATVAFAAISTGRFGFPVEASASIMAHKIVDYTFEDLTALSTIIICLEHPETLAIFERAFGREISAAQNEAGAGS